MTRKITLCVILILFLTNGFQVIFGDAEWARSSSKSVSELNDAKTKLNEDYAQLEKISNDDFESKKKQLESVIEEYQTKKTEYETIFEQYLANREQQQQAASAILDIEEFENKDIYNVDFLWTIIGNYATEEGIDLTFNVDKNTTSALAINNTSTDYIVCDLKFIIKGSYINLTDFIYDIEDDDRLNFEINNFEMKKNDKDLQVTLTVREVKISTLIDDSSGYIYDLQNTINDTSTQIINSLSDDDSEENLEADSALDASTKIIKTLTKGGSQ